MGLEFLRPSFYPAYNSETGMWSVSFLTQRPTCMWVIELLIAVMMTLVLFGNLKTFARARTEKTLRLHRLGSELSAQVDTLRRKMLY